MVETLRKRLKSNKEQNATTRNGDGNKEDPDFAMRESPLTILMNTSAHTRTVYHIFIVILIILSLSTIIYDMVKRGRINFGQYTIVNGFGDVRRTAKLWLYLLLVATTFYPLLGIYAAVGKTIKRNTALHRMWSVVGLFGLTGLQVILMAVPIWDLSREHLALASSVTVTMEMFRFSMKIHAAAMGCKDRCIDNATPMPSLRHYFYFLFAPTLLYRDQYPRTKKIRWGVALYHFAEVVAIIFYYSFLWERFVLPHWSDFGKTPRVEAASVVRGMIASVFPGVMSLFCMFYCLLHAWCNAFAEIMTFGDRLFYEKWWTQSSWANYYRLWNRVVHSWIRDHLYRPLVPLLGRGTATFCVFFVSAAVHEIVITLSFGYFYPVQLIQFAVFGTILVPLTSAGGKKYPNLLNLFMWLLLFVGNGLFWSLYPMEYFARQNCPPSENDSFFIPKSWSCPEIIL